MWLLAKLLCELTGTPRQKVVAGIDFEWSPKSWTHNVFRIYECIFWRRSGIRAEAASWTDTDNIQHVECYTWEATIALIESTIRAFLHTWKPNIVRIYLPVWVPTTGYTSPTQRPYLLAVAFDTFNHTNTAPTAGLSHSLSYTCTGSNGLLMAGWINADDTTDDVTSMTYNSVTCNRSTNSYQVISARATFMYTLVGPATGANTLLESQNESVFGHFMVSSYSGVSQTGFPDNSGAAASTTSTTLTKTLAVGNSTAWMQGIGIMNGNNGTVGTSTTARYNDATFCIIDSNGVAPSAGNLTLTMNQASATTGGFFTSFVAVGATAATIVTPTLLTLMTG